MGRVKQSIQTTAGTSYPFSYVYDAAGGLESVTYPSSRQIQTCHDSAGRPMSVAGTLNSQPTVYASSVTYAPHGGVNVWRRSYTPSGSSSYDILETTTYDARLKPLSIQLAKNGTTEVKVENYYCAEMATACNNDNGNLVTHRITTPTQVFTQNFVYDKLSRVTSATEGTNWSQNYGYDSLGNRWLVSQTGLPNPVSYVPTASTWYSDPNPSSPTYKPIADNRIAGDGYDNAGNLLTDGVRTFSYDAENRLKTAVVPNMPAISYAYDGEGRRVQKTVGSTTTTYVYDAMGQLAAEYGVPADTGTDYLTADHLGSTRLVVSAAGDVKKRSDYVPFGEEIPSGWAGRGSDYSTGLYPTSTPDLVTQKFTGKERDAETGLDYFGARYFTGARGRFTSPDPLMGSAQLTSPQTWNRYTYGINNPLRNTDPSGLYDWDASAGGSYTDDELTERASDHSLSRKNRNAAKKALKFRENFRAGLETARDAAVASENIMSQASVEHYGQENDHNHVLVGVAASDVSGSAARTILLDNDTVTVNFNPGLRGNNLAVTIAHEGRHVGDAGIWYTSGHPTGGEYDLNHYSREERAWYVSSYVAGALGMRSYGPRGGGREFQVWNSGWRAADRETLRSHGVDTILHYMGLTPTDANTYSSEHHHVPH
jgi:RHS repeat-associated protein